MIKTTYSIYSFLGILNNSNVFGLFKIVFEDDTINEFASEELAIEALVKQGYTPLSFVILKKINLIKD